MTDPIAPYADLIRFIWERLEAYINRAQREKDVECAKILATANVLTVSLRALDSKFKSETSRLRYFTANTSNSQRHEIESQVRKFAEEEVILPEIEKAVGKLQSFSKRSDKKYVNLVKELIRCGDSVIMSARGAGDFSTCFNEPEMEKLLQEMKKAEDEDAAQGVRKKARAMLDVYDRRVIAVAERNFGQLDDMIHAECPAVPASI